MAGKEVCIIQIVREPPSPKRCSCQEVRQVFNKPDEVITFEHVKRVCELGAVGCSQFLFMHIYEKVGDVFPECFGAPPSPPPPSGGEKAPNPRIVDAYMEYDGNKLYAGNTVEIREGTEMKAVVTVKNEGADGRVFVWVYDYDTHKIVKSKEVFMKAGEQKTYVLTFVPELGDHRYSIMVGLELGTYTDFAGG